MISWVVKKTAAIPPFLYTTTYILYGEIELMTHRSIGGVVKGISV